LPIGPAGATWEDMSPKERAVVQWWQGWVRGLQAVRNGGRSNRSGAACIARAQCMCQEDTGWVGASGTACVNEAEMISVVHHTMEWTWGWGRCLHISSDGWAIPGAGKGGARLVAYWGDEGDCFQSLTQSKIKVRGEEVRGERK
jgi:hypothetical protein